MIEYIKVGVNPTTYKIQQLRDDGTIRFVDNDHAGFLAWKTEGNVLKKIEYIMPIKPLDDDINIIKQLKKEKIVQVSQTFIDLIESDYSLIDLILISMNGIENGNNDIKYTIMMNKILLYKKWHNNKINEIKTCTLISQLKIIDMKYS